MENTLRIEIDGRAVDAETLWSVASAHGHFTAMQVRASRTRGPALHLDRLAAATTELFDAELDRERLLRLMRHGLGDMADASLRVYVFDRADDPAIMVTVRPPGAVVTPQRLQSVPYQRPDPHLKHLATGQGFYTRLARRNGFDEALLTGGGVVSETATANICFFDGTGFVWPDAPQLQGITMQLLERRLPELDVPSVRRPVSLDDVASFAGAFVTNARGVAAVSAIDDTALATADEQLELLAAAYASVPWEPL
jgi:branched-subunit amino acid aminotransferase/4-amino-4-deoxychorismate lyase